ASRAGPTPRRVFAGLPRPWRRRGNGGYALRRLLPLLVSTRRNSTVGSDRKSSRSSCEISQHRAHLLSRAKQAIFRRFLGRSKDVADIAQAQTLIMSQFENHSFAGGKIFQRVLNPGAQLPVPEAPLGIGVGRILFKRFHSIHRPLARLYR